MEYRGYDSVGIATNNDHRIYLKKGTGNVSFVDKKLNLDSLKGKVGIGHTRWATHGNVSKANAHPHLCADNSIAVVHNGIIENYSELKSELQQKNIKFKSQTDTEVIPNLLSVYYKQTKDLKKAMIHTLSRLKGNYAFVAMLADGTIAAAKNHEPLIIGLEEDGNGYFVSSDILGFIKHTREISHLEDKQFVIVRSDGIQIFDFDGNSVPHKISKVPSQITSADKGKFPHFTLKEIGEQTSTICTTSEMAETEIKKIAGIIKKFQDIYMCGSGTSYHAALVAQRLFPHFSGKRVEPLVASDVKFSHDRIFSNSIFVGISQSGESADLLESVSFAKKKGVTIASIVNSITSSLTQISDYSIPLNCGPEIGVAATKSFTSQLVVLYKIIEELSEREIKFDFKDLSKAVEKVFDTRSKIQKLAKKLKNAQNIYILGRGIHYPIAKEGALKIKEITYIHAEGIAAGELKHGPLALIDKNSVVIIINPKDSMYEDNLNSIHEIKARNAKVIVISDEPNDIYDYFIQIPKVNSILYPILEIVPLQLLAYFIAVERDINPDYPRNLAKSVTVK
jgi:glucosamine--fructose-6-phosphate aminotransferase (isomerizing)